MTGALVIAGPVDFEVCPRYDMVVWILDGVGRCVGELNVEVVVVNVNDNPPHFDTDLTYITVLESIPLGSEVYAPVAHDTDGCALLYAVEEEQSSVGVTYWLAMDDDTGHLVTRRPLEGAPRRMIVVITATDDANSDVIRHVTSMTLVVTVARDATVICGQDQVLLSQTQKVAVVEDADIGSIVTAASEALNTSSCGGKLTLIYSIISANNYDAFNVDPFTGQLTNIVCLAFFGADVVQVQ